MRWHIVITLFLKSIWQYLLLNGDITKWWDHKRFRSFPHLFSENYLINIVFYNEINKNLFSQVRNCPFSLQRLISLTKQYISIISWFIQVCFEANSTFTPKTTPPFNTKFHVYYLFQILFLFICVKNFLFKFPSKLSQGEH